jgi:hypothetical protein
MAISSAFALPCENSTGGVVNIWLTDKSNIDNFTLVGSEYTAVTMLSSSFFKYEFEQDTSEYKETVSRENYSTVVNHELEFYLTKMNTTQRDALQDLIDSSVCGMVAICQDANGNKWVAGYSEEQLLARPLKVQSMEGTTGKAFTDGNGSSVMLASSDTEKARVFTGTVPV